VFYRGNHLTIEAGPGYLSIDGCRGANREGLEVRVCLPEDARHVKVAGRPVAGVRRDADRRVSLLTDLRPMRIEFERPAEAL
jgi:hypothetical protein